jgi:hypothetical protein
MRTHLRSCAGPKASTWLLIRPTTPAFHLSLVHFLTTLRTRLGLPHLIIAHLSWCQCGHTINKYRYPFVLVPLREWTYNNPQHTLGYYCSYYSRKWSTCLRGILPFPFSHSITNGYLSIEMTSHFDGCCYCWCNSHIYGAVNIDNNNTCNTDGYSREYMIIRQASTRQWFHFP